MGQLSVLTRDLGYEKVTKAQLEQVIKTAGGTPGSISYYVTQLRKRKVLGSYSKASGYTVLATRG
jgi:hypothetical protein